jgi:hypothetical protein
LLWRNESLSIIEYNLSFDKSNWFSVSQEEMKGIKGYINGSINDMQSLLTDVSNNIPMEEDQFVCRLVPVLIFR